ncbi:MAG: hypothetical protein ACQESG_01970 [Nanobdellota archaeon]
MVRLIKVFEHEGNVVSLYYFEPNSLLSEMIAGITREIDTFIIDAMPSYEVYDMLKDEILELYYKHSLPPVIRSSAFGEGFSFIVRKEVLPDLLNLLDRISLWEMEEDAWGDLATT